LAAVLFALPFVAFGRLGETERELTARFGAPVSKRSETMIAQGKILEIGTTFSFRQGDWHIDSVVIEGRCAEEVYSKTGDWTDDQFSAVLTSNAQGEQWTDISKEMIKGMIREWHRDDGGTAVWHVAGGMVVTNPSYGRAIKRAADKAKAEASNVPKL
jgi:hypothetical protein